MKNLFIVALSLIILSVVSGNSMVEDRVFLLKNNTSILSSDILSIQNIVVSEYNKNFERYPPENRQLDSIFVLNESFKSTIFLSYYGIIGFAFQESNIPAIRISYQNQSQDFNFLGFFGASKGANLFNVLFYNISVNNENYRYGFVTSNSYLTSNNLIDLANNYYLLDYALYLNENASLNQNEEVNLPVLQEAAKELIRIYQSGNKMEMAKATLSFYQLSNDLGVSDDSAKKILEDLKNKDSFIPTPIIFTIISVTIFLILGFVFVKIERTKFNLINRGEIGTAAHISFLVEGVLAYIGFISLPSYAPNGMTSIHWIIIICSIPVGLLLSYLFEKNKQEICEYHNGESKN